MFSDTHYCSTNCCDSHKLQRETVCAAFHARSPGPSAYTDHDLHYSCIFLYNSIFELRFV